MPTGRILAGLALIGAALACVILFIVSAPLLRVLLSLPLVFFLPGNAVLAAYLPTEPRGFARLALSVGLSLAIVILAGLVLHLGSAMTAVGWLFTLCAITFAGYAVASVRHFGVASPWPSFRWKLSFDDAAIFSASLGALALAFFIATSADFQHQQSHFTEFWMTPDRTEEIGAVNLGIRNEEANAVSYDLELMLDNRLIAAWRGVHVDKGETRVLPVDLASSGRAGRLEAWLFKAGDHQHVYRRVWLEAKQPS
jgi:uncharacterized membrane protein